ncbi:MAG TPA: beta-ketoacyl synthase N-terminal-like domain-containing protein, partial [Streptosporangiaceae bacterium]|nr:beta-ketoacyl synthase N-terminal-like domain-containing protein [Streptosporangiaceae bacterium]
QSFAWFYAVNTGQISIRHGLRGPSGVLVSEQAGGLDAIGQACRQLRGDVQAMVTGGVDGALCPWGWTAQLSGGLLSTCDDPARAFLPFSASASGQVIGEGGAILVLEDAASAAARGVEPYGAVTGYAATFDGRRSGGNATGTGLRRAIEQALTSARLTPADIGLVLADGAGVADLDRAEAAAICAVFGPSQVPVSVPKTMTGRLLAGGAALDVATALLALRDRVIPPSINVDECAEGLGIDLVTGASQPLRKSSVLVLARGRGGFNAAVVVSRATEN